MPDSINLQLFDAYLENAIATGHRKSGDSTIPCPLCLQPIERADVASGTVGIEHIVPQHATKASKQSSPFTRIGVTSTRSGLTLTCTACNQHKGRNLDFPLRGLVSSSKKPMSAFSFETGTAVLTYAYLFAFAHLGYEYAFHPSLDEVRHQFQNPSGRVSDWLEHAQVNLNPPDSIIVGTSSGYPCALGFQQGQPLKVMFWRFRAQLPNADFIKTPVNIPPLLATLVEN